MIDYLEIAQEYHGKRNDELNDPYPTVLFSDDDYVKVRYDAKAMTWITSRPSRIKYQTARKLVNQFRKKYAERWGL